jgi:type IV pilus assembly protein PilA
MNDTKNKRLNNGGFSLVELIIVIAIMAVLVGVLAPQYMKYVEKSRQAADLDNYDSIISALEIYATDPTNTVVADTTGIKFEKGKATTFSDADTGWMKKALYEAGITTVTMKSTTYGNATITADVDGSGYLTVKINDNENLKTALGR